MNIRYNQMTRSFETEFSSDFSGDLTAVKAAGFRYDGAQRIWWTVKLPVLDKIRANKPLSGLTITNQAYTEYLRLTETERINAEVRAKFAPIKEEQDKEKKKRKKKEDHDKIYIAVKVPPKAGQDFDYTGVEDLPSMPPFESKNPILSHQGPWCHVCASPVYFYELQSPPTCLFCENKA